MADVTVVPANVVEAANGKVKKKIMIAGEALVAGKPVIESLIGGVNGVGGTKKAILAKNDSATNAKVVGITMCDAALNQPIVVATDGILELGTGALTPAQSYFLSNTAGKICPDGDISTAGEFITLIGLALDGSRLLLIDEYTGEKIEA
jgi:hypothetical protein